ncbi:MAG: DUF4175 family protein, partial [Roseicyclus sp.]
MTQDRSATTEALARLIWPLRLTRAGLFAERVTRAFWPLWSMIFLGIAALAFGAATALPPWAFWALTGLFALALVWSVVHGVTRFSMPSRAEALERLDRTMPGRPITALLDTVAVGCADP